MSWEVIIAGMLGGILLGGLVSWWRFRCPEPGLHVRMPPVFNISSITCAKLDTMTSKGQVPARLFDVTTLAGPPNLCWCGAVAKVYDYDQSEYFCENHVEQPSFSQPTHRESEETH